MDIVKNLKDYDLTSEQRIFVAFMKEYLGSNTCNEKIINTHYVFDNLKQANDLLVYTTAYPCDETERLTYNNKKRVQ